MNRICDLFNIKYPIIQGGMVWVSGAKLAASVSEAGGLGLIGAGSMKPDILRSHIIKAHALTEKPFGVNIPIFSKYSEEQVSVSLDEGVKIFFMSAGSPKTFTTTLKERGCTVVHVTSTPNLAVKCQAAGVDAVVVEGFEAGGHNGRDELTTMVLIPQTVDSIDIPVIAAGGIADGRGIAACMILGAEGVQIGSRFAATVESSASETYKKALVNAGSSSTMLMMKSVIPVRLVKNALTDRLSILESQNASPDELVTAAGDMPAKKAIFDGYVDDGEIEAGQIIGMINDVPNVDTLMRRLVLKTRKFISSECLFEPFKG